MLSSRYIHSWPPLAQFKCPCTGVFKHSYTRRPKGPPVIVVAKAIRIDLRPVEAIRRTPDFDSGFIIICDGEYRVIMRHQRFNLVIVDIPKAVGAGLNPIGTVARAPYLAPVTSL